jgi:CheY-like chemotaxis protein
MRCLTRSWRRSAVVVAGTHAGGAGGSHTDPFAGFDRQESHTIVEANNARSAVNAMEGADDEIDVVRLDYRLPQSIDLSLLADVRRLQPRSVAVMMTAYGRPEVTDVRWSSARMGWSANRSTWAASNS